MATKRSATNPFYALLLVVGVVFAISACAYGVMTVQALRPGGPPPSGLLHWLEQYGTWLLAGEIAVLAVLTCAAISTDDYWTRPPDDQQQPAEPPP